MDKRKFYDKKYSSFAALPGYRQEEEYCLRIIKWLKLINCWPEGDHASYLDAGCGFGIKTHVFSRHFSHSFGIDFSENAIEICGLLNDSPDNLSFSVKDIEDFADERYDMITAFGLSYFNSGDIELLAKSIALTAKRLLNQGGILFIGTRTNYSGKSDTGWHYLTKKELKQLKNQLKDQLTGAMVEIVSPDNKMKYLNSGNAIQAAGSLRKSILNKPKDLFIIIKNG